MNKTIKFILLFLLIPTLCFGAEITTARGAITINNGDTVKQRTMPEGQIKGLKDVTFIDWNFTRENPHTEVFVDCSNLTFIDCNLVNVELQDDFIVDSSLTLHKRRYSEIGVDKEEVELRDGTTKIYRIDDKDTINETRTLLTTKETEDAKKIQVKYVNPKTRIIKSINTISAIDISK
jgi:hypothetical protein